MSRNNRRVPRDPYEELVDAGKQCEQPSPGGVVGDRNERNKDIPESVNVICGNAPGGFGGTGCPYIKLVSLNLSRTARCAMITASWPNASFAPVWCQ